jgi:hypothetical protein
MTKARKPAFGVVRVADRRLVEKARAHSGTDVGVVGAPGVYQLFARTPLAIFSNPGDPWASIVLVDCAVDRQVGPPQW